MAKPDSETPLTDLALGRTRRTTMSLFRNPTTGGIERPAPAPEAAPKPAEEPNPVDEELAALRARRAELADIRRTLDKQGRDLEWLARFGTKAPY